MPGKKRAREDVEPIKKIKKVKFDESKSASKPAPDEIDFPRGGGSTFTPIEYKTIWAEATKEANAEILFKEDKKAKKKRSTRGSDAKLFKKGKGDERKKKDHIRVEHLNYKRLVEGMKVFCQIIAIQPLALILSLPCQLVGHVPITHVSTQLTKQLEDMEESGEEMIELDDDEVRSRRVPELFEIFRVGQYVRAVVTAVRPFGSTAQNVIGLRHKMDETERACQRVELSIAPNRVNAGVSKEDLAKGFVLPGAVQSIEDHGYVLDLGIASISGFLSFKNSQEDPYLQKLPIGHVLDVCITNVSDNGRTCDVSIDQGLIASSALSQINNVTSILPGALVQALVTAVVPSGLNVQLLGFFNGTIDVFHLPSGHEAGDIKTLYKLGQKIKARILWDMTTNEPRTFGLSLLPHVIGLETPRLKNEQSVQDAFPIGTTLEAVKVLRVEPERGLVVVIQDNILGYVHIRHVSDDHVPSLSESSGLWKVGTVHRARVNGFQAVDGILQLSLQHSVLEQKFLQVADVKVGEFMKVVVKKLTDAGLFVSLSGNVDGVVWPNHYADIHLKHPQKRFKEGATIKCRVLVVDPDRKRIVLTAKRTLVESQLPIIGSLDDVQVGTMTHGVVFKVLEKGILVEFYNNLHALVPLGEASEVPLANLAEAFPIGKPIKIRIITVDRESGRMVASIRQATSKVAEVPDVHGVQVGETVHGPISAIHKHHAIVKLEPTGITALLTLNNLASSRSTTVAQLRSILAIGEQMDDLVVRSQNPDKGIVIVCKKPTSRVKAKILPRGKVPRYVLRNWWEFGTRQLSITISASAEAGELEIALPSGSTGPTLEYFKEGQKVDAIIKKKEKFGVFLVIKDTKVSGLCHRSEISDNSKANVDQLLLEFQENDLVRAMIILIDLDRRRISFSLKPSRFTDDDYEMHEARPPREDPSPDGAVTGHGENATSDSDGDEMVDMDDHTTATVPPPSQEQPISEDIPTLRLEGGFRWSNQAIEAENAEESSANDSDNEPHANLTKVNRKKKAIEYDLTADMHTRRPESTADFERLLLGSPNSSYLWVQYMSFQLQLSEIDKAKEVGKRALRTISFREEAEKLNVWMALLNLENKYGTDETLEAVFKDAARHNDSKTIHLRLASIFDETQRYDRAAEQYQKTCKKFGKSSKVWSLFAEYYLKRGEPEAARQLLPRSLQSLEKRKHLKTITKFAQLEYKLGDPERGRTIFEGIVDSHPKRWDLWSVYVDMEATQRNIQGSRNIFSRLLSLKMTSHKAKAFFKKWLEIEKRIGDADGESMVKNKAIEWTRKAGASAG